MSKSATKTVQPAARLPASAHANLQRSCACGNHTIAGGECASCRKKRGGPIQRATIAGAGAVDAPMTRPGLQMSDKTVPQRGMDFASVPLSSGMRLAHVRVQPQLLITAPGDYYEQEADRVAELMSSPRHVDASGSVPALQVGTADPAASPLRISPFVQRDPAAEGSSNAETTPQPVLETRFLGGAGVGGPLPPTVRERMEERFGIDFRGVRIHTGSEAHHLADDIEALAFTQGRNIYFASGTYAPGTPAGDRLLAHELTHVVQQSGGASLTAGITAIQRARIRGAAFHAGTESRFLAANKGKGLLTEAPLPGGTALKPFDFEAIGFPDLYQSDVKDTAIGVRGKWETVKGVNPTDDPDRKRRYIDLQPFEKTAKGESGKATYSPKPQGEAQPLSAEFPESVKVGDIKPVWMVAGKPIVEGPALGTMQLGNYQSGITEFVKTAAADKKVTRGKISTSVLSGLTIPPELDYKNFEKENKSPSGNIIGTEGISGRRRYWMFEPPNTGLYYYFHLAHPNPSPEARTKLDDAFNKLQPIKKELHNPDGGIHSKLNLPKLPKRRPGALGRQYPASTASRGETTQGIRGGTVAIQRKESPRIQENWDARWADWEKKRGQWEKQDAKPLLPTKEVKALDERFEINNAIGLKGDTSPGSIAVLGKHLSTIKLWSGETGKALGKIRFALGKTFDKVAGAFDWLKAKLSGFWNKLTGAKSPDVGIGWRKTLVNLLVKAVKLGFRELVSVFFEMCANCLEGIIGRFVDKFKEDISDELKNHVEKLDAQLKGFEDKLKAEFEQRFGSWNQFIDDLSTAQKWASILLSMEALIRLGVQAVSCLTPPALGCLWGLVAQVGLEVALNLIMGTEWFQEHVINHPSVRDLIKQFAGPTIRSLIADTLRGVGLEDYAKDVEPCSKVKELDAPPVPPVDDPVSPAEVQNRRAEWERANRPQMLQDLQFRFHTKFGQPATEGELESLVAAMARSGKSPEQLKEIIESTPKWSNGKYDLGAIRRRLAGDSDKPGPRGPSRQGRPEVGVSKGIPGVAGTPIEVGPQVFQPPPGGPPGERGSTLPGAGFKF